MLDPYKLFYVNVIIFSILLVVSFLIRKKKNFPFIFLLGASILPLVSLLRKGVHESGDFAINISKSIDLYHSLSYGIFPVHWASLLNATYGYPLFLFTYPLPYYSITLFKALGFSFIASEKIVIAIVFILSGVGMYLLLKKFLKQYPALLGAVLYLYAPYHLVDMHFRVALGELFAYAALPFAFYFLLRLVKKINTFNFLFTVIAYSSLILSHQAIALVSSPFIFLTPVLLLKEKKKLLYIYTTLIFSIFLTAFYWLPVIDGINYTHQSTYSKSISFENPYLYIFSPWRYGLLYQGPEGQLSFPMGFIQVFLLCVGAILILKKKIKRHKNLFLLLLGTFIMFTFFLLPISEGLWKTIPFMSNFQFAYRLMLPISFVLAVIGAFTVSHLKQKLIIFILITFAMGSTILNWGTRATLPDITDENLSSRVPYSTFEAEGLQPAAPKWRDINQIWMKGPPKSPLEITKGKGEINIINRTPIEHNYVVTLENEAVFVENTYYFPGWNLYVNGKRHSFTYEDKNKTNLIRFGLPKGEHKVNLRYEGTNITKTANLLSLIALILVLCIAFYLSHSRR